MLKLITIYPILINKLLLLQNKCSIIVKKNFFLKILLNSLVLLNLSAMTLKNDYQQIIKINSIKQSINLKKNVITFIENVTIKQGLMNIKADKVIVTRINGDVKKMTVEAYGTPATFYKLQNDIKLINGHSNKIRYETEKKIVILTGNVYLEQIDSNIKSDKITYLISSKQIEALSDKEKKIITTLFPSKLENIDTKKMAS